MNKLISLYSLYENIKKQCGYWVRIPRLLIPSTSLITTTLPRFNICCNVFEWGPSGDKNEVAGTVTVSAGPEEGSVEIQVSLPFHILEPKKNASDSQLVHAMLNS
ncbi:hypothetical protein VNO78_26643 [Psophocarpus tetragonolobus]|uniref:Uncharacterized protein n=1 Tax=Psophocarpus tetragonolobus TaxID=3891 RepID=A0AAN9RZX5_PSOTE